MNPLIRHFLPSQVRGVYRYDETFGEIDAETYPRFVNGKLRFLPLSLIEKIKAAIPVSDDFSNVQRELYMGKEPKDTMGRRAGQFLAKHSYFTEDAEKSFLEIQFVEKILAPLLNDAGISALIPQKKIGRYYADFALEGPSMKLAIEVDGFGKFEKRADLDNFMERQNFIASEGWRGL